MKKLAWVIHIQIHRAMLTKWEANYPHAYLIYLDLMRDKIRPDLLHPFDNLEKPLTQQSSKHLPFESNTI